jgi:hypothetical protein
MEVKVKILCPVQNPKNSSIATQPRHFHANLTFKMESTETTFSELLFYSLWLLPASFWLTFILYLPGSEHGGGCVRPGEDPNQRDLPGPDQDRGL